MKKKIYFLIILLIPFLLTGCTNDDMEDIDILVSNYPIEYITKKLYNNHSTITQVYPDGVDTKSYEIKNINKLAKYDLFIYNGLIEKERNLAFELLSINPDLKIIDSAYTLESDYSPEELWLNPSYYLMMAGNIRLGLEEFITSSYLKKEIDAKYEKLKINLSELDASYRVTVENTNNRKLVIATSSLKYLEKYNIEIKCIDNDATDKTIEEVENLINLDEINYIITFNDEEDNEFVKKLIEKFPNIKKIELHRLDNITDDDRKNDRTYISIMNDNLELLKKELY